MGLHKTTVDIAKQGAKLALLLATIYYTAMVVALAITLSLDGTDSLLIFFSTLAYLFLVGLILGAPAGLTAMAIGFLTGLLLSKALSLVKPRHAWQAGFIGFLFSIALALTISAFFGFPSAALFLVEIPLAIFVASTTYASAQLPTNPDAILQLVRRLKATKVALGLVIVLVIGTLLINLVSIIALGTFPRLE